MARVDIIAPAWDQPLFVGRPALRNLGGIAAWWRRVRPHALVAAASVAAGVLLWLPGGFELGLIARLAIGLLTGAGIAAVATTISLTLPRG